MTKIKLILLSVCLSLLAACASQHHIPSAQTNLDYFARGKQSYNLWLEQSNSLILLAQAIRDLEVAHQQQPDHINIQYYLYRSKSAMAIALEQLDEANLLAEFNQFNLTIFPELVAPAYLDYLIKRKQQQKAQKINLSSLNDSIKRAIKQNPYSAQNWYALSEIAEKQGEFDLAIVAAKRANQMTPKVPEYLYRIGASVNQAVEEQACIYEQRAQLTTSLDYFEQAIQLAPEEMNYIDYAAFQHFRLGHIDKAFELATITYQSDANYWNSLLLAESGLLTQHFSQAKLAIDSLFKLEPALAYKLQLMQAIAEQDAPLAVKHLELILDNNSYDSLDIYVSLLLDYLLDVSPEKSITFARFKHEDDIIQFFKNSDKLQGKQALLTDATDVCKLADAHYFIGFKALTNRDYDYAIRQFQLVKKQQTYRQPSYIWASILLNLPELKSRLDELDNLRAKVKIADPDAQVQLAIRYLKGRLVEQDIAKALDLLKLSAAQEHGLALTLLGYLYQDGEYIDENKTLAIEYFQRAAKQKVPRALFALANSYYHANGVAADPEYALTLYQQATELNYSPAIYTLARFYQHGNLVEQDINKAKQLLLQAAELGNLNAQYQLAVLLLLKTQGNLNSEEQNARQTEGLTWLKQAGNNGHDAAQVALALYYHFTVSPADYPTALYWYQKAAEQGNPLALNNLADMYENGQAVSQDYNQALELYQASIRHGGNMGYLSLANLYLQGKGVEKNANIAFTYLVKGAMLNHSAAQLQLALWYWQQETPEAHLQAKAWLNIAEQNGINIDRVDAKLRTYKANPTALNTLISEIKTKIQMAQQAQANSLNE